MSRNRRRPRRKPARSAANSSVGCYTKEEFVALNNDDMPFNEVIKDIFNNMKRFQGTLQNSEICKHDLSIVISLLLKVSKGLLDDDDDFRSKGINILTEVLSDRCSNFQSQLKIFVGGSKEFIKNPVQSTTIVHNFFEILLQQLPNHSWGTIPLDECFSTVENLSDMGVLTNTDLFPKMKGLVELRKALKEEHQVKKMQAQSTASAAKRTWDNTEYRTLQILPRWEEISDPRRPYQLRPNIVEGKYDDWMHYFDIQFRLLREDFISPLREGISDYLKGKVGREVRNVKVFQGVTIIRPVFTRAGLCHEIRFDTRPFKGYRWEHSKRLIFGSLLCLSPDHFRNKVFFATVSNRDPRRLPRGYLEVMFQGSIDLLAHIKLKTEFVMVESMAYFEASRHILRSLQEAEAIETFTKYIISNDCRAVSHPQYLDNGEQMPNFDIQFIVKSEYLKYKFGNVPVLNNSEWPTVNMTELDESQLQAIKMALTQEIAVIQGPPGTGKTYIGLKIVQALLKNRAIWNSSSPLYDWLGQLVDRPYASRSPILVMCFTNHALDQFLEGILAMNDDIKMIRIGGRSKNEMIQQCSLGEVKRKLRNVPKKEYVHMKELASEAERQGGQCNYKMQIYHDPKNEYIPLTKMKQVIDAHHYWSLIEVAESAEEEKNALELWLGLSRKEVIIEYETVTVPVQKLASPQDSDDESSYSTSDYDSDEDSDSESLLPEEGIETVNVAGEANIEEDSRMVDEVKEMFEEMKFTEKEDGLAGHQIAEERTIQVEVYRTVNIVECDSPYELKQWILSQEALSEEEVDEIRNVNVLHVEKRYQLYKYWHNKYRTHLLDELEEECKKFNAMCEEANKVRQFNDRYALDTADVIGMTTTGAAKYQHVLEIVKPKIVIVEEAAEVLESHIVSALNTGTHHLILIGDHKQLRPNPNDYDLAIKYKLEISLFERLVMNGFPHVTLQIQHRMRPEISNLVRGHIYDVLYDHESVKNYPEEIKGVEKTLFFIQHNEPEKPSDLSHSNEHEARYLAALCKFLLQQGYQPSQITILVTYTGQLLLIKKFMPKNTFEGVRVTTVDNFQGEENDIILLSLVRSNDRDSIGFLRAENRVCVALSRAKHGFYCIGNFHLLRKNAEVWEKICTDLVAKGSIGERLSVHCNNHRDYKFPIKYATEFEQHLPTGGCNRPCEYRLPCGHVCGRSCHSDDPDHKKYECKKPCTKSCETCGKPCSLPCYQECRCTFKTNKKMPSCGHLQEMFCYQDPTTQHCRALCVKVIPFCGHEQEVYCCDDPSFVLCQSKCEKLCPEGHLCPLLCSQACSHCRVKVTVTLPLCGHKQEKCCFEKVGAVKCLSRCEKSCPQGHPCPRKCHENCGNCHVVVSNTLRCGHTIRMRCFQSISDVKCKEMVTKELSCGHTAHVECYKVSSFECKEEVTKTLACKHTVKVKCFEKATAKCNKLCQKLLPCGHKCRSQCGEPCDVSRCLEPVEVTLLRCHHKTKVPCYQKRNYSYFKMSCPMPCEKKLLCGHQCTNKCGQMCIKDCQEQGVEHTCPQGHKQIRKCFETYRRYPCTEKCFKKLSCGHSCQNSCSNLCTTECKVRVMKPYPCGHKHNLACSTPVEDEPCDSFCRVPLACGHRCRGKCSDCWSTRIHKPCEYHISLNHFCGESIKMDCVGLSSCHVTVAENPDKKVLHCMHKAVLYGCTTEPFKCTEQCRWQCTHDYKCTKLCHEPCDRPPCDQRCPEVMDCGHQCIGLCGEPCISTCYVCDADAFKGLLQSPGDFSVKKAYTQLPCGHIYTVEDMDKHTDRKPISVVSPLQCPKCFSPLNCSYRYGNKMKEALLRVKEVSIVEKSQASAQKNVTDEMRDKLKHVCRLPIIAYSDARGCAVESKTALIEPIKVLLEIANKLKVTTPVNRDEGFLFYLLAKVVLFAISNISSIGTYLKMLDGLVNLANKKQLQLSFQMLHDLVSEVFRLCAITKFHLSQQGASVSREPLFLKKYNHPHSRMPKDDFLVLSQLLDSKLPNVGTPTVLKPTLFEKSEEFVRDIDYFFPVILRGCWMKCGYNHYYCIPVCEPETLTVQCPGCIGNHLDSISVKQRSIVEVDVAKQTTQVLATIKATKSERKAQKQKKHRHEGDTAAQPQRKKTRKKKKTKKHGL